MGEEHSILGYCDRCTADRFFKPLPMREDSEEALSFQCTGCGLHYLDDELPEPRMPISIVGKTKA